MLKLLPVNVISMNYVILALSAFRFHEISGGPASRQTVRLLFKDVRCLLSCLHNAELGLPVALFSELLYGQFYFTFFIN